MVCDERDDERDQGKEDETAHESDARRRYVVHERSDETEGEMVGETDGEQARHRLFCTAASKNYEVQNEQLKRRGDKERTSSCRVLQQLGVNVLSRKLDVPDDRAPDEAVLDCHLQKVKGTGSVCWGRPFATLD